MCFVQDGTYFARNATRFDYFAQHVVSLLLVICTSDYRLPLGRLARALLGSLVSCLRGALGAVWDGLESNGVEVYGLGSCDAPRGAGKIERIS